MSKIYSGEQRFWQAVLYAISALVVGFLIIPILIVVPLSFSGGNSLQYPLEGLSLRWYEEILFTPVWRASLENSIIVASLTTVVSTVLGTMAAIGLSNPKSLLFKPVYGLLVLPMIVPLIITALGIYFAFAYVGLLGSYVGLVMAHSLLAAPFVLVTVHVSLQRFDWTLMQAGASLGGRPLKVFLEIMLPLILPGVASGAAFAFVISFDEVVVALFISSPTTKTMPIQLFSNLKFQLTPAIVAASCIMIAISLFFAVIAEVLLPYLRQRRIKR